MSRQKTNSELCPCCSGKIYVDCCEPLIENRQPASTAEQLMRSRYTAYYLGKEEYLLASWHPDTRPAELNLATDSVNWIRLKILRTEAGEEGDTDGIVEFEASYKLNGRAQRMREISCFTCQNKQWLYISAK